MAPNVQKANAGDEFQPKPGTVAKSLYYWDDPSDASSLDIPLPPDWRFMHREHRYNVALGPLYGVSRDAVES